MTNFENLFRRSEKKLIVEGYQSIRKRTFKKKQNTFRNLQMGPFHWQDNGIRKMRNLNRRILQSNLLLKKHKID